MPASLYTHVMRYCDECKPRCRGHREERPPVVADVWLPEAREQRKTVPLDALSRLSNYRRQLGFRRRSLTARQERQLRRMTERAARRGGA